MFPINCFVNQLTGFYMMENIGHQCVKRVTAYRNTVPVIMFLRFKVRHKTQFSQKNISSFFSFFSFFANKSIVRRVFIAFSCSFSALSSLHFHLKQPRHFHSLQSAKMRFKFQILIWTSIKCNNGTLQTFIPLDFKVFDWRSHQVNS